MQIMGLCRLGRDAELRSTTSGDQVASLSLAFNYGKKGADGKKPTQWLEGALWGARAEALAPHLTKGTAVCVTLDEPHIETFNKQDGSQGIKLVARVSSLEFAGGGEQRTPAPAPAPRAAAPAPRPQPQRATSGTGFDDMDDDIPF